jgi:hypothetical protein
MTDEERQKLCKTLRWYGDRLERELSDPMREAANELERLAERLQYQYACDKAQQREIERLTAKAKGRRPIYAEALLREARPYVASAKGVNFVDSLLRDIDGVLAQSDAEPVTRPRCRQEREMKATTHSLERTNPKGQNFIGRCVLCGATNLPAKAALWPCPNSRQVSQEDMLIEAIEGPADYNIPPGGAGNGA